MMEVSREEADEHTWFVHVGKLKQRKEEIDPTERNEIFKAQLKELTRKYEMCWNKYADIQFMMANKPVGSKDYETIEKRLVRQINRCEALNRQIDILIEKLKIG